MRVPEKIPKDKDSYRQLYPLAKKGHNAYNEAYNYLKYKIRPERIQKDTSFKY